MFESLHPHAISRLGIKIGPKMTPKRQIGNLGIKNRPKMTPNHVIWQFGVKLGLKMRPGWHRAGQGGGVRGV